MSNFKGTKGKWEKMKAEQLGVPYIVFIDNDTIFQCYGKESEANAQLIAHAPELLEMLEKLACANPIIHNSYHELRLKAFELIKKATEI